MAEEISLTNCCKDSHTAAEIVFERANAEKENMGLTFWKGKYIKKSDSEVSKKYLNDQELDALNKIVTAYLDIAEVQALNHELMYMKDWLETIDDYLNMTRRCKNSAKAAVHFEVIRITTSTHVEVLIMMEYCGDKKK